MLARPEIQRRARHLVHQWNGDTELGEVDGLHVAMARLARVHPNVLQIGCVEIREFSLVLFAARWAEHASKRPRRQATRAHERSTPAIACDWCRRLEEGELRRAA